MSQRVTMTKFLVTYHGGSAPAHTAARQQMMADFMAWVDRVGPALIDPGAPLGPSTVVAPGSVVDGHADGPASGYSVIEADDLAQAAELVRDHPFVTRGGSLQVSQSVSP